MGAHWRHLANINASYLLIYANAYHHHNRSRPSFRDHPRESVPEENFWTLWCKGRLTEADTPTIRLGTTPSGLSIAHLHHSPIFLQAGCPSCCPTNSVKALKAYKANAYAHHFGGRFTIEHALACCALDSFSLDGEWMPFLLTN